MITTNRRFSQTGFSIIETMLAIMMISLVGILGSRSLLNSTRSVADLNAQKKVSTLAEMVFQQYGSYAVQDYNALSGYDQPTPVTPATFFNKTDNMGFDGLTITTLASYAANRSTATVNLTLTWYQGSTAKSALFQKTYAATSQVGGSIVQLYVKNPCNGLSDPLQIIAQCSGITNFVVTAPGAAGQPVTVVTDAAGQAYLKGVRIGSSINVTVTAQTPSGYTVPTTDPNFVQGYYVTDVVTGNYTVVETTYVSVAAGVVNTIVVTDFKQAGVISGTMHNTASVSPTAPVDGIEIEIPVGTMALGSGDYAPCTTALPCTVYSAGGTYSFNNVIPSSFTISLLAQGRPGSYPTIKPGELGFIWGCVNDPAHSYNIAPGNWSSATPPVASTDLYVTVLGWVNGYLYNKDTSAPMPNFTVGAEHLQLGNTTDIPLVSSVPVTSDASGRFTLYNCEKGGYQSVEFVATVAPTPGNNGFYVLGNEPTNLVGVANTYNIPVTMGYSLIANITGGPEASGLVVGGWGIAIGPGFPDVPVTDSSGHLNYSAYIPIGDPWMDPYLGDVHTPWQTSITPTNTTVLSPATLTGRTYDTATQARAPHTTAHIWEGINPELLVTSDGTGQFNNSITIPYIKNLTFWVACDPVLDICVLCDNSVPCVPSLTPPAIHIDFTQRDVLFKSDAYSQLGYKYYNDIYSPVSGGSTNVTIAATLVEQMIQGQVQDSHGNPISNVIVGNVANNYRTDSTGHFGPFYATIDDATRISAGQPGTVREELIAQQTYKAGVEIDPLPVEDDATVPQNMTITLQDSQTPHGGL